MPRHPLVYLSNLLLFYYLLCVISCVIQKHRNYLQCSVSCGTGIRTRNVECVYRDQIVDGSLCSDTQVPKVEQCRLVASHCFSLHQQAFYRYCILKVASFKKKYFSLLPCAKWEVFSWSACSVSCGSGRQTRTIQCLRGKSVVHESECDAVCVLELCYTDFRLFIRKTK